MLDRTIQPDIRSLSKIDILKPEHNLMPNGTALNIIRAGEQEVVRMDILFRGGRYQQSQPLQALFTNRMLREGSKRYSSGQIEEELDYYGAWLELSAGMEYSYLTLYSLNKYFPQVLEIIESIVKEPTFPEKEFRTTLETNKQQFLINSMKGDFVSHKYFNLSLFGAKHPNGRTATIDDYEVLTPDILLEFHDKYYCSANCSIYLSGKVTNEIIRETEKVFGMGAWGKSRSKTEFIEYEPLPNEEKRLFIERPDAMQNSIRLGCLTIKRDNPDYLKIRVLLTLFGGYFGSRLMSNIREDKGYTYGISAGISSYPGTGVFSVATEANSEYTENIIKEIHYEMNVLKDKLVPEEELSAVRNYMLGQMCRTYEGAFSLADAWTFIETNHLNDKYYQNSLDAVREITPEEIRELAMKYFHPETLSEVIAGKKISNKL